MTQVDDGTQGPRISKDDHASSGDRLATYPLLDALLARRSRRFARGLELNGGPLAYRSTQAPQPLTLDEEAALAFAACGITGYALGELPYDAGDVHEAGGGNILAQLVGRTAASADALHTTTVFVFDDDGAWMLRRPQDYPRDQLAEVIRASAERRLGELYELARIRLAEQRPTVPREIPFVPPFNKWSANMPGTTYFLPVVELSALYINVLLAAFDEEEAYYVLDDRQRFRPAGLAAFARSRGGHLHDDPAAGRVVTVGLLETSIAELAAVEVGGVVQNLGLMTQALGLGGFPHFASHPFMWFEALGFRMEAIPLSRVAGAGPVMRAGLRVLRKDVPVATAVGLERAGEPLLTPFCPPYYPDMRRAVEAFIDFKFAPGKGTLRDEANTPWRDGATVEAGIPRPSERAVAATVAYCDYVYQLYGRFPAASGPFRTVVAYQAHHLDVDFYDAFYRPQAVTAAQRQQPA